MDRDADLDAPTTGDGPAGEPTPAPRVLSPLAVLGIIALVGSLACTVALAIRPAAERGLVLPLVVAASGLLGAWLIAWGRPARWVLPGAVLGCALGATAFSIGWLVPGWPLTGLGLGALGAWSYRRRQRALVASVTLVTAGYAVAAAAGAMDSMRSQDHWWVVIQGLGSMLLGGLLLRLGTEDPEDDRAHPAHLPRGATHARLRVAGRLLIVAGILLPYAALVLAELAELAIG